MGLWTLIGAQILGRSSRRDHWPKRSCQAWEI